ncbi:related to cercosporin resistance protein [Phialocephala subalpina]|uniref:Related to cercosporin resistance protein n=1 Tax=Phialocephala subalpina TaxID=576137 RepID=A0A1L7X258_9HELO|nr:related to cercosporin resistance protein [Phialocephala subalpina]
MDQNGTNEEASSNKRAAPKLRRSCETCRNSKGRCLPSDDDSNRCQKCLKDGKACVFLEAKPRPKRAKNSRIRVAEMEEKLEGLLNLLAAQTGAGVSVPQSNTTSDPSSTSTPSSTRDQPDLSLFPSDMVFPNGFEFPPSSARGPENINLNNQNSQVSIFPSFQNFDRIQDIISKGVISFAQAEEALRRFQVQSSPFPFVVVLGMSLDALRRHRPFLLLAILAMGTENNETLQRRIEKELKETLSRKLIVSAEKSLDLIQGILVYLAWYHFYFDVDNQQLYQLCQMATSLAVDIGINKPLEQTKESSSLVLARTTFFLPSSVSLEDLEARRTYLGCYYVSSQICHGLRKPNNLKYTNFMEECAQSLAEAVQVETDRLLPFFIQLQRLSEEVNDTFDYNSIKKSTPTDAIRIGVLAQSFAQQLEHIESSFSPEAWNNAQLTMQLRVVRIFLNEIGFHATALPENEALSPQLRSRSWYYSTARSETMLRCIQACKDYLDFFIAIPPEAAMYGTLPDILGYIYAVLVLGAFATSCDSPILDQLQVREIANYDYYLNSLINNLSKAMPMRPLGSNPYLNHIFALFQQTKIWYAQILMDPTIDGFNNIGNPGFSFMDILPTIMNRCVDFASASSFSIPDTTSDEQWNELLSGWSASLDPTISLEGSLEQFQA